MEVGLHNPDILPSEYQSRFERLAAGATQVKGAGFLPDLMPEQTADVIELSQEINRQAGEGLARWESTIYPGVSAVHTRMSAGEAVKQLAQKWGNKKLEAEADLVLKDEKVPQEIYVLFSSIPGLLPGDGSTHTAFDIAIERMGIGMARVANGIKRNEPIKVDVYCVGNAASRAGRVTEKLKEDVLEDPFGAQAKLDAEVVYELLKANPKAKITLIGQSWGGAEAVEAARVLEEMLKEKDEQDLLYETVRIQCKNSTFGVEVDKTITRPRVRVFVDDPVPLWAGKNVFKGMAKNMGDETKGRWTDWLGKLWFPREYDKWLKKKGIYLGENLGQRLMKKIFCGAFIIASSRGPIPDEEGNVFPKLVRVVVRQAMADPLLAEKVKNKKRSKDMHDKEKFNDHTDVFLPGGNHAMDRFKQTTMRRLAVVTELIKKSYFSIVAATETGGRSG